MKRQLKIKMALFGIMFIIVLTTSCDSYEKRMARYEKAATEYKASLGNKVTILAEVIDSTTQEIIYMKWVNVDDSWDFVDNDDKYGIIEAHNYATGTTENVMKNWPPKDDYHFFRDSRLIKNRLFLNLWDGRYGSAVVYVNLRDNSIHDVAFPERAELSDNQITLTEMYVLYDSEHEYEKEYGRKEFVIKTDLSDAEYESETKTREKAIRDAERQAKEKMEEEKRLAEERKREAEKYEAAFMEIIQLRGDVKSLIESAIPYRRRMDSEGYGSFFYQSARIEYRKYLNRAIEKQKRAVSIARNRMHDEELAWELEEQLESLKMAERAE